MFKKIFNKPKKYWYAVGDKKSVSEDWANKKSEEINNFIFSNLRKLKIEYCVTQIQGQRFISIKCSNNKANELKNILGEEFYINKLDFASERLVKISGKIIHYYPKRLIKIRFMEKGGF